MDEHTIVINNKYVNNYVNLVSLKQNKLYICLVTNKNNNMRKELKFILGLILIFIAWGLIGNDEYEFQKRHETVISKTK